MAFCTQCGTRLPEGARFCPRCGAPAPAIDATDKAQPPSPRTEPTRPPGAVPVSPTAASALSTGGAPVGGAPASRVPARDLPPEGLHFGPAYRSELRDDDPRATRRPVPPAPAPVDADDRDEDGDTSTGTGTRLLVILALVAVAVLAIVFWQQRDGTRPVAESATNTLEPAAEPSDEPTEVASAPLPEPTPTPSPSPTLEVVQTGDEVGSSASLDPNGEAAIPAAAIDAAFADDPDRAGEEFPGPVTVRGTVIGLLSDSPPALSLEGHQRGGIVVASLARGQREAVEMLSRGSVVRLRCASVRYQAGTTVLDACRI